MRKAYLVRADAARYINRSERTLERWRRKGWVKCRLYKGNVVYETQSLKVARRVATKLQAASRLNTAGPGRPLKYQQAEEQLTIDFG